MTNLISARPPAQTTKPIKYSEIFYSIQGEGEYTGIPTAWVRFFLCNLRCDGFGQKDPTDPSTYQLPYKDFDTKTVNRIEDLPVWEYGCDSSYSWSAKFKHLQMSKTASEICDEIQRVMTNPHNPGGHFRHAKTGKEQHLCFTGGEPLLPVSQRAVIEILKEFKNRPGGPLHGGNKGSNHPESITFETNGTQPLLPEFEQYLSNPGNYNGEIFFSVSPKLFTVSGENSQTAIKPDVVRSYYDLSKRGQLKFVVGANPDHWEELDRTVDLFRQAGVQWDVWIMPIGANMAGQHGEYGGHSSAGDVAKMAYERGYNVSARVHVYLWDNVIGV